MSQASEIILSMSGGQPNSLAEASCGILDFISFGQLKDWLPLSGVRQVEEEWVTTTPTNALEFLRSLKAIGGRMPHPGHRPLPYKTFKKVMDIYNLNPQLVLSDFIWNVPETRKNE